MFVIIILIICWATFLYEIMLELCVSKKHKLAWWFSFDLALGRSWVRTLVSQNLTLFVKRLIVG